MSRFPSAYFLDTDLFRPIPPNLSPHSQFKNTPFKEGVALIEDVNGILGSYFSTVHSWLPMISKKTLYRLAGNGASDVSTLTLVLSIRLILKTPNKRKGNEPWETQLPLYGLVKACCSALEAIPDISLRLVQSLILLAVFEYGHGIFPAAFLTIGKAARMAQLMGLNDKSYAAVLYTEADTWTLCEEQRRTWWAMFIIER